MAGHAGNGGLQKHSIGELYPFIIVGYGDGRWGWQHAATGETSKHRWRFQLTAVADATVRRNVMYMRPS